MPLETPRPAPGPVPARRLRRAGAGAAALLAALALVAAPAALRAAELKMGYIDSARIFQEYADAKESQARFDRQVQSWRDDAAEKEKQVKQLRD